MTSFLSMFSGIEAASVAWHSLGWKCVGVSEIEKFPSAVLAHHYPDVPNLGDVTADDYMERACNLMPDIVVGGSPCQSFSVAGLRKSLSDDRGNLALRYIQIIEAIDATRIAVGRQPVIIVYENVPGLLSTKDNAFGCFLGALAGEDCELQPPGGKWKDAGVVYGPKRAVAWRVLDAQYFGLAQRRRRVFVVASARAEFDPAAVLFEFEGVRRDIAPSRENREELTHATAPCLTSSGRGVERTGETRGQDPVVAVTFDRQSSGEYGTAPVASTVSARDYKGPSDLIVPPPRGSGFDASEDGTGRGTPLVAVPHVDTMPTLRAGAGNGGAGHGARSGDSKDEYIVPVQPFDTTQITSKRYGSNPQVGDPCHPLARGAHAPVIVFHPTQDPISSIDGSTHALGCGSSGGQASIAVAFAQAARDVAQTITSNYGKQCDNSDTALGPNLVMSSVDAIGWSEELTASVELAGTLQRGGDGGRHDGVMTSSMQVRRLTPVECERLQGFPDGYTDIKPNGKPTPDGPRYKALGNSMATNVMRWIGKRIDAHLRAHSGAEIEPMVTGGL